MIHFNLQRLPSLYNFKLDVIQLCLSFIREVIKSSSNAKPKGIHSKLGDIETDLYDIFCRWNFNALQNDSFDLDTFLPTGEFVQMVDLAYYLNRFNIKLEDTLIPFPHQEFQRILQRASRSVKDSIPSNPPCSDLQLSRLRSIYKGNDFDTDVRKLVSRYIYLGGLNNSLSTPPEVLSLFLSHELFGTPLNTCCEYCSPLKDETVFDSHGSFFSFDQYQDDVVYFANTPFDDSFCTQMTDKLLKDLERKEFSLIVIIPVWDTIQQQKYKLKDFGLPFDAYNRLVTSKFFQSEIFLPKGKYPFFNYFYNKLVYISNTHMLNLGKPVDLEALQKRWLALSKK